VLVDVLQTARRSRGSFTNRFWHLGALGLFLLAIVDSSPVPTFAGADILTAILSASRLHPWYEYGAAATAGSVIGAYLTFRIARRAGLAFLDSRFGHRRLVALLKLFRKHGTAALAVSCAIPLPFPTSAFFAAAGASNYRVPRFLRIVAPSRAARYFFVAFLAHRYGRQFVRAVLHPERYWGWLLLFAAIIIAVVTAVVLINRRLQAAGAEEESAPTADRAA
jgi:membrane protein YqaA with SNARE-associated domain